MHSVQTHRADATLLGSLVPAGGKVRSKVAAQEVSAGVRKTVTPVAKEARVNVSIDLSGDDWAYAKSNN